MLGIFASVLAVVCKRMQQLPTICNTEQGVQTDETCNIQQCMELFVGQQSVASVCVGLYIVWTPAWSSDSTKLIKG